MNQSPVLLHVWSVHPDEEATLVEQLANMIDHVTDDAGFVSARILASPDRTSVAALIEMKSIEDRQRLQALPVVRDTLYNVEGAYNVVIRLFHEVGAFSGASDPAART